MSFPRVIIEDIIVPGPVEEVYRAWTTLEGIKSFFAPDANIKMEIMGPYEIIFLPDNPAGLRGGEGNVVLSFLENKMFSFTWNSPPELKTVRNDRTHVFLRFKEINESETRLLFQHDGWGEGGEWEKSFGYFEHAWKKVVLPRLQYRFRVKPVDWDDPPVFR